MRQPLGVANRQVLHAAIAAMHEPVAARTSVQRLLERVEQKVAAPQR
jgi:hypothetical protein